VGKTRNKGLVGGFIMRSFNLILNGERFTIDVDDTEDLFIYDETGTYVTDSFVTAKAYELYWSEILADVG
jgi:hypothetical protein